MDPTLSQFNQINIYDSRCPRINKYSGRGTHTSPECITTSNLILNHAPQVIRGCLRIHSLRFNKTIRWQSWARRVAPSQGRNNGHDNLIHILSVSATPYESPTIFPVSKSISICMQHNLSVPRQASHVQSARNVTQPNHALPYTLRTS